MMKQFMMSLLWMASFVTLSAQNSDADLRQYFKAIGLEKKMKFELEFQLEQINSAFQAEKLSQLRLDSLSNAIQASYKELEGELSTIYQDKFTPKEIKALKSFYESPVGQKLLQMETVLSTQSANATTVWSNKVEDKISVALYGMTLEERRAIAQDNEDFIYKVTLVRDSAIMARLVTNMDTIAKHYRANPSDRLLKKDLANQYNNLAWYQLMAGHYKQAEINLQLGLQADSTNLYLHTNVPLCYLLQGKFEEAKKLYWVFKEKPYGINGAPLYKNVFLKDLRRFQTAEIIPAEQLAAVEKIKTLLNESVVPSKKP